MIYKLLSFSEHKFLNEFVYDIYRLQTTKQGVEYSTAPNGIVGISIIMSGKSEVLVGNNWEKTPKVFIYGLIKTPDVFRISANYTEIAIGFKPYFLQLLIKNSMSDIIQTKNMNATDIFTHTDEFYEQLCSAKSEYETLVVIEKFLLKQLNPLKTDKRLLTAMKYIYDDGITNVSELSEKLNLSSTSVRNIFRDGIGRSPKEVVTILRINNILKSDINSFASLTELCYKNGYFDQSHFINDFRDSLGMTPSQYFNNNKLAFDFYNSGRWEGNIFEQSNLGKWKK